MQDFALRLTSLVAELAALSDEIIEQRLIEKYLRVVPAKFEQIALSIETLLDLSELTLEDVTGRLKAVEDRAAAATPASTSSRLLLTEEEWRARCREQAGSPSTSGRSGRGRGKPRSGKPFPCADDE